MGMHFFIVEVCILVIYFVSIKYKFSSNILYYKIPSFTDTISKEGIF